MTSTFYLECPNGVALRRYRRLDAGQQIGFIEDCFQNRAQGRLDTGLGPHDRRAADGQSTKVVPKQSVDLHGSATQMSPLVGDIDSECFS